MIRVRYRPGPGRHSFVMAGHADYAPHGEDIVCAGASGLCFALMGWLENQRDKLPSLQIFADPGEVVITCHGDAAVKTAFDVTLMGLAQIAKKYPDHMTVEYMPQLAADTRN